MFALTSNKSIPPFHNPHGLVWFTGNVKTIRTWFVEMNLKTNQTCVHFQMSRQQMNHERGRGEREMERDIFATQQAQLHTKSKDIQQTFYSIFRGREWAANDKFPQRIIRCNHVWSAYSTLVAAFIWWWFEWWSWAITMQESTVYACAYVKWKWM